MGDAGGRADTTLDEAHGGKAGQGLLSEVSLQQHGREAQGRDGQGHEERQLASAHQAQQASHGGAAATATAMAGHLRFLHWLRFANTRAGLEPLLVVFALMLLLLCAGGLVYVWANLSDPGGPRQHMCQASLSHTRCADIAATRGPSPLTAVRQGSFSGAPARTASAAARSPERRPETTRTPPLQQGLPPPLSPFNVAPSTTMSTPQTGKGCLCPCLVVPHGQEFNFLIPERLTRDKQDFLSYAIVDPTGHALCKAHVNELGGRCAITLQLLDDVRLAEIRTDQLFSNPQGLPEVYRASGELFARVVLEQLGDSGNNPRSRRYHLNSLDGKTLMTFQGDFKVKFFNGMLPSGLLACSTSRCAAPGAAKDAADAAFYEVRIGPFVDAGLVLCGLLAIEKAEAFCGAS